MRILPIESPFPDSFFGTSVSLFRRRTESLVKVIPRGPFWPHVPLLVPFGTSLSHGNAVHLVIVLLLSIDIQGYTGVMYGLMKHIMETTSFVV